MLRYLTNSKSGVARQVGKKKKVHKVHDEKDQQERIQ